MLTRIISGAVGVVIMAVVFVFHNTIVLPIAVAAMIAVMLFELLRAVKMEKCIPVLIASELCGIVTPFAYANRYDGFIGGLGSIPDYGTSIILFGTILTASFVIFVTWLRDHNEIRYEQVFFVLAVMIFIPQAMSTMIRIDRAFSSAPFLLIMGLCGAWIADTGAYFTGVALGKHKLCPEISPKKTIEGLAGGIITTGIVYAAAFSIHDEFSLPAMLAFFTIGSICAVIGTIGDLSASMVKRQIGFKDYGKIMPGHGGLMDRFDSVLFVLPTFFFCMQCFEWLGL